MHIDVSIWWVCGLALDGSGKITCEANGDPPTPEIAAKTTLQVRARFPSAEFVSRR